MAASFSTAIIQAASLDHALWFHRPFRADEWLLYAEDSPSASGARGFNRGSLFSRDGRLVASVAQEGLIRVRASRRMSVCLMSTVKAPGGREMQIAPRSFCLIRRCTPISGNGMLHNLRLLAVPTQLCDISLFKS